MVASGALQASRSLEAVARALAQWTVERHAAESPGLAERYGRTWREDWCGNVQSRIAYLAQAVAVECPDVFVQSMLWVRRWMAARAGSVDDLRDSLRHLSAVIAEETPAPLAGPATACIDAAVAALKAAGASPAAADRPADDADVLRYLEFVLASRRDAARSLVMDRARSGASLADVFERLLQPAQIRIGEMWHRGQVSIADEHAVTAMTQELIIRLADEFETRPPRGARVITAAVGGDFHEIGLRMVAECLRLDGWDVVFLGANLPGDEAIREVKAADAALLALSVSTFLHLRDAAELIAAARAEPGCDRLKVVVGGAPFTIVAGLAERLGADGHASDAREAVSLAGRLLGGSRPA